MYMSQHECISKIIQKKKGAAQQLPKHLLLSVHTEESDAAFDSEPNRNESFHVAPRIYDRILDFNA